MVVYLFDPETGVVHINKDDFITYCGKYRGDMEEAYLHPDLKLEKRECKKCRKLYGPDMVLG